MARLPLSRPVLSPLVRSGAPLLGCPCPGLLLWWLSAGGSVPEGAASPGCGRSRIESLPSASGTGDAVEQNRVFVAGGGGAE